MQTHFPSLWLDPHLMLPRLSAQCPLSTASVHVPSPTLSAPFPSQLSFRVPLPLPDTARSQVQNPLSGFAPKQTKESSAWWATYIVLHLYGSMCLRICVCVCVCVYVCANAIVCVCVCVLVYVCVLVWVLVCICVFVCVYLCVYGCVRLCVRMLMYVCMCVCLHEFGCLHVCVCISAYACLSFWVCRFPN